MRTPVRPRSTNKSPNARVSGTVIVPLTPHASPSLGASYKKRQMRFIFMVPESEKLLNSIKGWHIVVTSVDHSTAVF